MSETREDNDHRHGKYLMSGNDSNFDSEELANACRRLGITGPLEPLLRELKIKENPNVKESPRKVTQKKDKKSSSRTHRDVADAEAYLECNLQTANKAGKNSFGQESWGRDSGARDLSPAEHRGLDSLGAVQQMGDTDAGGSSQMMHLASKLQVAALSALKTEVLELSARLQNSERERDSMQKKLVDALDEKERSHRRLEAASSAHESRLTEMHCVIVELSKKLKNRQDNAIIEEHEPEGSVSDLSFQEGSVYNSEMECTNLDQQSQTEPLDAKLVQPGRKSDSPCSLPPITNNAHVQLQAMHEEILYLRSHMALLQNKLASMQDHIEDEEPNIDVDLLENLPSSPKERSNYTSDDLCETAEIFESAPAHDDNDAQNRNSDDQEFVKHCVAKNTKTNKIALAPLKGVSVPVQLYGSLSSLNGQNLQQKSVSTDMPVSKMAERVRLRRTVEEQHITGPDIMNTGICTTEIAEHLVSGLLPDVSGHQNEMQRLQRRIEHLRVQNTVLTISLAESKGHCEHLYLLCGKYESNAIALNQALHCSDRTIEAYDVMLALLESKLGILENADSAIESRKAAEAVARHLMTRLEGEHNIQGNSMGPWQDPMVIYGAGNPNQTPWTDEDDQKLRAQMSKLKGHRTAIQNTVVLLESPYSPDVDRTTASTTGRSAEGLQMENRRMDLETAVLMQELMSMREDTNDYKSRTEEAQREKNSALERLAVMQQALLHLQAQLADSETLLAMSNKDRSSYSEAEHTAGIEMELVEALARESRLKARLQGLAGSLEAAAKSSEEKYAQIQHTVAELKHANCNLTQSLDRCKRKYQTRLKKLEYQIQELSRKAGVQNPLKQVPETTL